MADQFIRRAALLLAAIIFVAAALPVQAQMNALRVQGITLANAAGRFVIEGINLELYRDPGCSLVTTSQIQAANRTRMIAAMKAQGINLVRLNYSYSWLNQGTNLAPFLDWAQALAAEGIYSMPTDHTFTGQSLNNRATVFALFKAITDGYRARGIEGYLVWNPYNEPGGENNLTWAQWVTAQKDTLNYLRGTAAFDGVVVLDTRYWAADFNLASMREVQAHDASLRGGTPNVVFSNHWYPNIGLNNPTNALANAGQIPLIIGELGQYNATPLNPQYVRDVLRIAVAAIPAGFNGVVGWIAVWCDDNSMFRYWDNANNRFDGATLTSYGQIYASDYYSKVDGGSVPPAATAAPATATTAAPPTATRTPTRTSTPAPATAVPTTVPTAAPTTATPVCIVINTDGATITICAK